MREFLKQPTNHKLDIKEKFKKAKDSLPCLRCSGLMVFEKFYGPYGFFFGWHCVRCGDVVDPVILLHRLSHDANVSIPESEEEMMGLIKRYMRSRQDQTYIHKNSIGKDAITL